jgi:propionyl-CoA synthetase
VNCQVLSSHRDIAEAAVVGIHDDLKGQIPIGLIVLNDSCTRNPTDIEAEAVDLIRRKIGPVACLKTVITVKGLPKTRSGKILRSTLRAELVAVYFNRYVTRGI